MNEREWDGRGEDAHVAQGTWVEVGATVLAPGARAPQVPEDTRAVALEMTVKGFLLADGALGEEVEILTRAGRRLRGRLLAANPAYRHRYGAPVPELAHVGPELRTLLRARGGDGR